MAEWTDSLSINHEVAPGEAHTRMSLVERRHAVLRKAIEVYISDLDLHGPDGLRTALTYILPAECSTNCGWLQPISVASWVSAIDWEPPDL